MKKITKQELADFLKAPFDKNETAVRIRAELHLQPQNIFSPLGEIRMEGRFDSIKDKVDVDWEPSEIYCAPITEYKHHCRRWGAYTPYVRLSFRRDIISRFEVGEAHVTLFFRDIIAETIPVHSSMVTPQNYHYILQPEELKDRGIELIVKEGAPFPGCSSTVTSIACAGCTYPVALEMKVPQMINGLLHIFSKTVITSSPATEMRSTYFELLSMADELRAQEAPRCRFTNNWRRAQLKVRPYPEKGKK